MKTKVIALLIAGALFYGMAVAGAVAHRNRINIASLVEASNSELSQKSVENR